VVAQWDETARARTIRLALDAPSRHRPGQHFVVRLTAPDGYTASRSYSVASAPDDTPEIELTVERLDDGEVSTFLHDVLEVGDELEVRGPIGGWFVWDGDVPVLLVGGGSGIVPLMAMLRDARARDRVELVQLVLSARTPDDVYYRDELVGPGVRILYTRAASDTTSRPVGRLTADDLGGLYTPGATAFVCGSPPFCNAATDVLAALAVPAERIRVERFGPS
jgi:ferredoxin-NADP reductase